MKQFTVEIPQKQRLDTYLLSKLPDLSRASIQKLCNRNKVLVNGTPQKAGYKVRPGEKVTVAYDFQKHNQIPDLALPMVYEDADSIVINKPDGVLSHSKGAFNPEATVATFLRPHLSATYASEKDTADRAGIVHRLDRATLGVMILAKTPEAFVQIQKQFSSRKVKKTYIAIVSGHLDQKEAIIDMPIERNPKKPQTFRVGVNGKVATTAYIVLEETPLHSLIQLTPTTGRTHQLRVHLKHLEHPIVGDTLYGGEPYERMLLHAASLELTLPSHERRQFSAPLPESFTTFMQRQL